jgi:hypothetical protein
MPNALVPDTLSPGARVTLQTPYGEVECVVVAAAGSIVSKNAAFWQFGDGISKPQSDAVTTWAGLSTYPNFPNKPDGIFDNTDLYKQVVVTGGAGQSFSVALLRGRLPSLKWVREFPHHGNVETFITQNLAQCPLTISNSPTIVAQTAYLSYIGRASREMLTSEHLTVQWSQTGASSGITAAEVAIYSATAAPNGSSNLFTHICSTAGLPTQTTTGLKESPAMAIPATIDEGTHLFAAMRMDGANFGSIRGLADDWGRGIVQVVAGSAALTDGNGRIGAVVPWSSTSVGLALAVKWS